MKQFLFLFLALGLFLTTGCDKDQLEGSGNIISDDRSGDSFSAIDVSDALDVTINQGSEHRVIVRGDDNLITRIITSVSNGVFTARLQSGSYRNVDFSIEVTVPTLERINFNDAVNGDLINFTASETLTVELNDASRLDMSGSAPSLILDINDASNLDAFSFTTEACTADVNDASSVRLTVNDRLEGRVSDASSFRFRGNPALDISTSGASRVIDAN
ncbi:GIN domain-containing protein [Neolewinella agarilytica]|uniref:Putative auto-transporter adhesin, head GIN domain n=1 Tax=Neolewinella agarilytica TaxID=478744 RepID=A0A1H9DMW7_9BACT|nr:DUF2807 domain-containing protein [Neolewinella agarilytica]SEQ14825.1 Putative auto-transporter adhesin, head GIN domain [Neolewinella agarilytica]